MTFRASRPTGRLMVALFVLASVAGCGDAEPVHEGPVDRETFIATYVDLRLSALGTPTGVITEAERTRVLEEHGVTGDDLEGFAQAWGSDPAAMKAIWEEVQRRLRLAAGEDTASSPAVPANIDAH
ncbi:hypothetical protein [Gaopeijia maritima]|uniref:DUF4296 domain-containing protein n=1 Tax=Gaopeijia maritima TaxID=3119007 RepID=A0ABU9E766_9BACT